jgi:hypothetical protein
MEEQIVIQVKPEDVEEFRNFVAHESEGITLEDAGTVKGFDGQQWHDIIIHTLDFAKATLPVLITAWAARSKPSNLKIGGRDLPNVKPGDGKKIKKQLGLPESE